MKKILCFSLAILILTISILAYCPLGVFASYPDDYFSLPKPYTDAMNLSSSDAQAAVNSHKDIADSNGVLCFQYTPTNTYNWTMNTQKQKIHLTDNQLKNLLMSKHSLSHGFLEFLYGASNSDAFRGFMSFLGVATKTGSSAYLDISDKVTGNYNYLNAIDYNEDTQTIVMSNDNSSVDKLREEIKKYYYDLIGLNEWKASGTVKEWVDSPTFRKSFDYEEDYNNGYGYSQYNYVICSGQYFSYFFNEADLFYISNSERINLTVDNYASLFYKVYFYHDGSSTSSFIPADKAGLITHYQYTYHDVTECALYRHSYYGFAVYPSPATWSSETSKESSRNILLYSKDKKPLKYFSSYGALYNYMNGDQNAYLSSTIEKTGEDITFSIKDMNENLGNKMDALIDSINSNKSNMSADELQSAIDKGLEDLNKNTEDIKDNTSDILDVLREQNQILLDILGVTTNIYKVVKESDSKEKTYNINYVQSVFNSMFKGLKNAVLYGENTVRDDVSEDTDNIDSIVSDVPPDKKNYHNGLFGRFPFSVPYQLFDWLQALYVDPVAPKFTLSYAYLFKDLGYETNNFEFIIDLGDEKYSKWIELVRSGEKLSFIIYMAIATYHRFKNEI